MEMRSLLLAVAVLLPQLLAVVSGVDIVAEKQETDFVDAGDNRAPVVRMSLLAPALRRRQPLGLSWSNCDPGASLQLRNLTISPQPVNVDTDITVGFAFSVSRVVPAPLSMALKVKKKTFGEWITVPCIDGIGSCSYADVCTKAPATCPTPFVAAKVPCKCPLPVGTFKLPSYTFRIHVQIPAFLKGGSYQVHAVGTSGGKQALCVDLELALA